MIKCRN